MLRYHVESHPERGWVLREDGKTEILRFAASLETLYRLVPKYFGQQPALVLYHSVDGSVVERRIYPRTCDPAASEGY
ncbi:hypothetical protein [Pseudomonas subflava]|uniref:hypothetical protein n=1 Tax=Pseudomonas subflava TaxID=2952933 RepID=UPI00207B0034|nr:hypothetical protein [Pseudomonas subflava]